MATKFTTRDLHRPGAQVLVSLTANWPVVRKGEDLLGDFRTAAKTFRLRTVLEGLKEHMLDAKLPLTDGVRLVVVNQLPYGTPDRIGAALLAAPEVGTRLGAGVSSNIAEGCRAALNSLQSEAYSRMVNLDILHKARQPSANRPAWLPDEREIDPIRAALVRAGRRQTLWRVIRGGAAEQFDIPAVPPTEPKIRGTIVVDGSIISTLDRTCRLSVQGACKASALVNKLGITARTFACQVDDQRLYARIRGVPLGQSMTLEMDVVDVIANAGELLRSYRVTDMKSP